MAADSLPMDRSELPVGHWPNEILEGDFNGDGEGDLAIRNLGSMDVSILLQNENGRLSQEVRLPDDVRGAFTVADFDGDGHDDIAYSHTKRVFIRYGDKDLAFEESVQVRSLTSFRSLVPVDLNNDGRVDLVATKSRYLSPDTHIFINQGDGRFLELPSFELTGYEAPVPVDINGDGFLDLVRTGSESPDFLSAAINLGDGSFGHEYFVGGYRTDRTHVTAGDFNGDGYGDIAVAAEYGSTLEMYLGRASGTFELQNRYEVGESLYRGVATDMDSDGLLDFVVSTSSNVLVFRGTGDGSFLDPVAWATEIGNDYSDVAVLDIDRDGHFDLVATLVSKDRVLILNGAPFAETALHHQGELGRSFSRVHNFANLSVSQRFGTSASWSVTVATVSLEWRNSIVDSEPEWYLRSLGADEAATDGDRIRRVLE